VSGIYGSAIGHSDGVTPNWGSQNPGLAAPTNGAQPEAPPQTTPPATPYPPATTGPGNSQ
jgi:hypothetical protein